ncbi:MAG: cytidylate kinase-like family protein [Muribaculaceae bacterium]|nr:cytidylate kinase-like family protein [Muribaculaceae bacterium]
MDNQNFVITIGRQFGSGGRELGSKLAKELGIAYYDKELLEEAAKQAGISEDIIERSDERFPSFFNAFIPVSIGYNPAASYLSSSSTISADNLYKAQSDVIETIAQRHSCVIVGRSADYVLRNHPRLVSIFIHANMDDCIDRIMGRGDCKTREEARAKAEKTNKLRASYYNFYTDKTWGNAASYDLTINSSTMSMDKIVKIVADFVRCRF